MATQTSESRKLQKARKQLIRLFHVTQNNLKGIDVDIPTHKMTVITGVSGSGKSSLAFETLYAEGQRRYVDSLSTYTRQFLDKLPRPQIERVENIPPAIALEQRNSVLNNRSTVGSTTELNDYLRIVFARAGEAHCPDCKVRIERTTSESVLDFLSKEGLGKKLLLVSPIHSQFLPDSQRKTKTKKTVSKKPTDAQPIAITNEEVLKSKLESLLARGLTRILRTERNAEEGEVEEVAEIASNSAALKACIQQKLFVVFDRLRLTQDTLRQERSRLLDSIESAFQFGDGVMHLVNLEESSSKTFLIGQGCPKCLKKYQELEALMFSSQSPLGACPTCSGFGFNLELDEKLVVPDPSKTLKIGAIDPFSKPAYKDLETELFKFARSEGIPLDLPYSKLSQDQRAKIWNGPESDFIASRTYPGIHRFFDDLKEQKYKIHVRVFVRRYQSQLICNTCHGSKLKRESQFVYLNKMTFDQVTHLTIEEALEWTKSLILPQDLLKALHEPLEQWSRRLKLLKEVGLSYLTISRLTKTLSGGEFQRVNLATQLGNGLCGTLYVLDEPSIGLHPVDTDRLIRVLKDLRDQGNTLVVVEHDLEVMRAADQLIELGPFAGRNGGKLIANAPRSEFIQHPEALTAAYLSGKNKIEIAKPNPIDSSTQFLKLTGCREHNLKEIDVQFPVGRWTIVTGVSGSGKSTLIHDTLYRAMAKLTGQELSEDIGRFDRLYGAQRIKHVALLDQSPIGKTSRSNPATYLKVWDEFRKLFSLTPGALKRGYSPQYFSFNVDGGRCPTCSGEGEVAFDMHFMAEVKLPCEACQGKRFKASILEIELRGKNVFQWLDTTIDETFEAFRDHTPIAKKLKLLREVGLGYLRLGQPATTLSGGESQRLKVAATLDERPAEPTLYLFDEPSTGLHLEDIKKLIHVFKDLVDRGHTIVMIEHHLDLIVQADWILDLGPGGGPYGGQLLYEGPVSGLFHSSDSLTGKSLKQQGYEAFYPMTNPLNTPASPSKQL